MKQLFVAVVLLALVGIAGFLYRSALEHPAFVACTAEAKICPDGSAVGRTGPDCTFAPCPIETMSTTTATTTLSATSSAATSTAN